MAGWTRLVLQYDEIVFNLLSHCCIRIGSVLLYFVYIWVKWQCNVRKSEMCMVKEAFTKFKVSITYLNHVQRLITKGYGVN